MIINAWNETSFSLSSKKRISTRRFCATIKTWSWKLFRASCKFFLFSFEMETSLKIAHKLFPKTRGSCASAVKVFSCLDRIATVATIRARNDETSMLERLRLRLHSEHLFGLLSLNFCFPKMGSFVYCCLPYAFGDERLENYFPIIFNLLLFGLVAERTVSSLTQFYEQWSRFGYVEALRACHSLLAAWK